MTWPNSWPAQHAEPEWLRGAVPQPCRRCRQIPPAHRYAWTAPSAGVGRYSEWSAGRLASCRARWHMRLTVLAGTDPDAVPLSGTIGSKSALNSANAWTLTQSTTQPKGESS